MIYDKQKIISLLEERLAELKEMLDSGEYATKSAKMEDIMYAILEENGWSLEFVEKYHYSVGIPRDECDSSKYVDWDIKALEASLFRLSLLPQKEDTVNPNDISSVEHLLMGVNKKQYLTTRVYEIYHSNMLEAMQERGYINKTMPWCSDITYKIVGMELTKEKEHAIVEDEKKEEEPCMSDRQATFLGVFVTLGLLCLLFAIAI